jgi:hypothetical protein
LVWQLFFRRPFKTMFRFTSNALGRALQLIRAVRASAPRREDPLVTFLPTEHGIQLRCATHAMCLQIVLHGHGEGGVWTTRASALAKLPRTGQLPLELTATDQGLVARWHEQDIPQEQILPREEEPAWPTPPAAETANSVELLQALEAAFHTTDPQSLRFALGCIRWRGAGGQLAATDGRQALLWEGFQFPWTGDVLVPGASIAGKLQPLTRGPVHVGRSDDWISLRAPEWQVWQRINHDGRFPDVDSQIPSADSADSTLELSDADARYLELALPKLPGAGDAYAPVTVELNGSVAVRAQSETSAATELILAESLRNGEEVRCCTNRLYLHRAVSLGFRAVFLRGSHAPAFCRDARRAYVWALLAPEDCIPAERCGTQLTSTIA